MKKRMKQTLASLLCAGMLTSAALPTMAAAANEATPTFDAISDLRYTATATTDGLATKGLLLSKSEAILDAALAKVTSDVLLVAGDLTEHGTQAEHNAVKAKLAALEATGKEVFVVPGEHDVHSTANPNAITKAQFAATYADFGYDYGTYTDDLSYTADVTLGGKTVSFFLLDTVGADGNPTVNNAWATPLMTAAKAAGKEVVAVGHHPSISRAGNPLGILTAIENIKNADGQPMWTGDTFAGLELNDESSISCAAAQEFATAGMSTFVSGHSLLMATATGQAPQDGWGDDNADIEWTDYCNGSMVGTGAGVRTIALAADGVTSTVDYVETIAAGSVLELARAAYRAYMPTAVDAIYSLQPVLTRACEMIQEIGYLAIDGLDISDTVPSGLQNMFKKPVKDLIQHILNDVKDPTTLTNVLGEVKTALLATNVPKSMTESTPMLDVLTDVIVTLHRDNTQVAPSLAPLVGQLKALAVNPDIIGAVLPSMLVNNFADALNNDCDSLLALINKVLDEQLQIVNFNSLRAMLAGPVKFILTNFNLWDFIDNRIITTAPDGTPIPPEYKPSVVIRPLVERIFLMDTNAGTAQLTKDRLISGIKEKSDALIHLYIDLEPFINIIVLPPVESGRIDVISDLNYAADSSLTDQRLDAMFAKSTNHYVLVTGNLTAHGTQEEHNYIVAKLMAMESFYNKEILVVPGENDIQTTANPNAITKAKFAATYRELGYDSGCTDNLEYCKDVTLGETTLRLIMMNTVGSDGGPANSLSWASSQALDAKNNEIFAIGVGHHPFAGAAGDDGLIPAAATNQLVTNGLTRFITGHSAQTKAVSGKTILTSKAFTDYQNSSLTGESPTLQTIIIFSSYLSIASEIRQI